MTIETTDGSGDPITENGPYDGNGATTVFDYDFQIQDETELQVTVRSALNADTTLVLNTDYTVSGVGSDTGGQITLTSGALAPTGSRLAIFYVGDYQQNADYSSQGGINLGALEAALDKITMHLRELKGEADRAVKLSLFDDTENGLENLQADIAALGALEAELATLAAISTDISTVAGISANVSTVAAINAEIATLAPIATAITNVNAIRTNVTTVAGIAGNVTTVAGISANVTAVANIAANITTVAGISASVTSVAGISTSVTRVAQLYQGGLASDPAVRTLDGSALQVGDYYFNTATGLLRFVESTGPLVWRNSILDSASTNLAVDPDNALRRDIAALKIDEVDRVTAWVNFAGDPATPVIRLSHNVASVTRLATGRYRITFSSPRGSIDGYAVQFSARRPAGMPSNGMVNVTLEAVTATSIDIRCVTWSGASAAAAVVADAPAIYVSVIE